VHGPVGEARQREALEPGDAGCAGGHSGFSRQPRAPAKSPRSTATSVRTPRVIATIDRSPASCADVHMEHKQLVTSHRAVMTQIIQRLAPPPLCAGARLIGDSRCRVATINVS
jgi:hypothetical protein